MECTAKWLSSSLAEAEIPDEYVTEQERDLRKISIARAAEIIPRAHWEKWKPATAAGYANKSQLISNWGRARGLDVLGSSMQLSRAVVALLYIDRVDEGEGVQPSSAEKELTVMSHWYESFVGYFPELKSAEHPVKNKTIEDLKKRAKLWFERGPEQKVGYDIWQLRELWGPVTNTVSGDWMFDHTRLAVGLMFFFLARSIGAAHVVWRGDCQGPIAASNSDILWGEDPAHGRYQKVILERDKTVGFNQSSSRYLPFENGSGIMYADYVRSYIRHYALPSGTYLLAVRSADGSFHDTIFTNWSRITNYVCAALKLERRVYGTQSCRRGCAQWLNACGLEFDQVGLLGFWLSDVVRRYTMVQAGPRLLAWKKANAGAVGYNAAPKR